jgi:hypothetical protein
MREARAVELVLERWQFDAARELRQRTWQKEEAMQEEELKTVLLSLMRKCEDERRGLAGKHWNSRRRESRKEKVNRLRQAVAQYLQSGERVPMRGIASKVGCSLDLVRTVKSQLRLRGRVSEFEYNNLHSKEDEQELQETLHEPKYKYFSSRDFKRVLNQFSLKKIRRQLRVGGKKWQRMPRIGAKSQERMPCKERMLHIITQALRAYHSSDRVLLFSDEMKFPLNQTPTCFWKGEADDEEFYNNRPENMTLTAIVLCSTSNFISVQFFVDEVTAVDFVYFMLESIGRLPEDKEYSILVDNATWHKAAAVRSSDVWRFLEFNEPGQFRVNLIENAFSGVRALWRQRAFVDSLSKEMASLVAIFSDEDNEERFEGYYFNHLRAMLSYFRDY